MAINKGTQYITDPDSIPVNTSTGAQNIDDALNDRGIWVEDLAALKAIPLVGLVANQKATITTTGRAGDFTWLSGDQSSNVSSDPQEGVYVSLDGDDGTNGAWMRRFDGITSSSFINIEWFGAIGDGVFDNTTAIQAAYDYATAGTKVHHPAGEYGITSKLTMVTSLTTLSGDGKYASIIRPLSAFDRDTYDCLVEVGDGVTNNHVVKDLGIYATYGSDGNDLSGLALNSAYNTDVENCKLQSGNYVNRENGGLLIRTGKHTRIIGTHFHNGFCYGAIIESHSDGLSFIACAFDETTAHIKSSGNILDMAIIGCEVGQAVENTSFPPPVERVHFDFRVGAHGQIKLSSSTLDGSPTTDYGLIVDNCDRTVIQGNTFTDIERFPVVHAGSKDFIVVGNAFSGNGSATSTTDPSVGTTDFETTTFCCDIYKRSAFNRANVISSNTTDISDRPMSWLEGSGSSPSTSNTTVMSNSSPDSAAYVHGVLVLDSTPFVSGDRLVPALKPVEFTIPTQSYNAGQTHFGNFTYNGLEVGDALSINPKTTGMSSGLLIRAEVVSSDVGRWYVTNASGVTISSEPARDCIAYAVKGS